jgi:hypothetical protein
MSPYHSVPARTLDPMKTAEIRGIPAQLRGSGTTETAIICSWFESRYPSSNRRRIPRRNSPSPLLPIRPDLAAVTRNGPETPVRGDSGASSSWQVRTRPGSVGPLAVQPAHLLGMDATTQITATFLTQHELAELLRLPDRTSAALPDLITV